MQKNKIVQIMLGVSASAVLCSAPLTANAQAQGRSYGVNHPFQLSELPPGQFSSKLNKLSPKARENAKRWLDKIRFHDHDLPYMRSDESGGIYIADPVNSEANVSSASRLAAVAEALPAGIDVFKLHSNPGAANVVYLDFDGHVVSGTAWNSSASPSFNALPYDIDGSPTNFSDAEKANIAEVWRRAAEDYAPFNIDVTTELPASFGPKVGRVLITKNVDANGLAMPAKNSGGVAYLNVWGDPNFANLYSPAFVYHNQVGGPDNIAEVVSHEFGHNLGLSHDGTGTSGYYTGQGTGFTSWAPIMGAGYYMQLSQWSAGEYTGANQTQDDVAIISSKLNAKMDDHSNTRTGATPLVVDTTGHVYSTTLVNNPMDASKANKGVITSRTDVDVFSFNTGTGNVVLQATPLREAAAERGGNLDLALNLYDAAGNLLVTSNPADETDAGINTNLAAGTYYLAVDGVGSAHYSDYGSLGQYYIEGVLPVALLDTTVPNPNPMTWAVAPEAKSRNSLHMTASTATDDSGSVEYYFACTSGGTGCADSGWLKSPDFTLNSLTGNTRYSFTVKARDLAGNTTKPSAVASAKVLANKAPIAKVDQAIVANNSSIAINVLANDSDPEADALAVTAVTQATKGVVSFTKTAVSYKPNSGVVGIDTFSYTLADAFGATATATVRVMITNRNPVAVPDSIKVVAGQTVVIPVLNNDYDLDGDALTISSFKQARRGYITKTSKELSYKAGSRTGSETVSYTISDGRGGKASAQVTITTTR